MKLKKGISILCCIMLMVSIVGCSSNKENLEATNDTGVKLAPKEKATEDEVGAEKKSTNPSITVYDKEDLDSVTITFSEQLEEGSAKDEGIKNKILDSRGSNERYQSIIENNFINTKKENTSTFSIDVDTASYANIRNLLSYGEIPDVDAVRIEEMINYFDYNYKAPKGDVPFSITTKVATCPWENEDYVAMIGLKGMEIERDALPPSNIVLLIDVSGSMQDANKLPLLKEAFGTLLENLTEKDRVSLVVYAGAAGVVLDGAEGSDEGKITQALNQLEAGGSTAGGEGLALAYKIARKNYIENGNNRVIIATDGDFNVGMSSTSALEEFISDKKEEGIFLSVLGFGRGNIRDDIMETLADKGNGNYAYIDSMNEANKVFSKEFSGTLFAIAKDVKIQIEFNEQYVDSYRLLGYENRVLENEDFDDDTKDAGELGLGHTVTGLYQLVPKDGVDFSEVEEELYTVKLRYKEPDEDKSQLLESNEVTFIKDLVNDHDLAWALAVTEFGLILRDSHYQGNASLDFVKKTARKCLKKNWDEYREEFINIVGKYEDLVK